MTGGIGFTRDGNNSLKRNKAIRTPRKSNALNPYWGFKKSGKKLIDNYKELVLWKLKKKEFSKNKSILITALIVIIVCFLLYFMKQ
jgi:hypothetical protein